MKAFLSAMSPGKRMSLFGLIGLVIVSLVSAAIWLFVPKYEPLMGHVDATRASQAVKFLEDSQVPFEVQEGNDGVSILVQEGEAERLRLTLSENLNLPNIVGLEIFDNADYSMTDFSQQVAFQRALQGELSRTLAAIPGVETARVHISLAPKRLFKAQQSSSSASVFLNLVSQFPIENIDASGIQQLVANAVINLEPKDVKVFDQEGKELSATQNGNNLRTVDSRNQIIQEKEQHLVLRASHLLSLYFPPENIAIAVSVKMNFDQKTQRKEELLTLPGGEGFVRKINEAQNMVTKQSDDEEISVVPGTSEKDVEYVHGTALEETVFSAGEIYQISIGVGLKASLADNMATELENLLVAGLGLDSLRGDKIHIFSTPIMTPFQTALPETSHTQPQILTPSVIEPAIPAIIPINEAHNSTFDEYVWWSIGGAFLVLMTSYLILSLRNVRQESIQDIYQWLEEEKS